MDEIITITATLQSNELTVTATLDTSYSAASAAYDYETANPNLITS